MERGDTRKPLQTDPNTDPTMANNMLGFSTPNTRCFGGCLDTPNEDDVGTFEHGIEENDMNTKITRIRRAKKDKRTRTHKTNLSWYTEPILTQE